MIKKFGHGWKLVFWISTGKTTFEINHLPGKHRERTIFLRQLENAGFRGFQVDVETNRQPRLELPGRNIFDLRLEVTLGKLIHQ